MIDAAWRDVIKGAKLISLPDVYLRLKSILDDPDFAMAEVAVVISQDPAITLRLLRLVNSSFYGFAAKIETVGRAIMLLGTRQVHDLVLATSVGKAFEGMSNSIMDMQRYWTRSVHCAVTSRQLATLCSGCDKERLFVSGILHDIGHLVMYQTIPELSQQAILKAKESDEPLCEIEQSIIGFDYAAAGAELMRQWSLPESLREITMYHPEPAKAEKYHVETALVHLGSLLARAGAGEGVFGEGSLTADPSVWAVTGLSPEDCVSVHDQVAEETAEVMKLICPR